MMHIVSNDPAIYHCADEAGNIVKTFGTRHEAQEFADAGDETPWHEVAPGLGDGNGQVGTTYTQTDTEGIPTATWEESGRNKRASSEQVRNVLGSDQANTAVAVGVIEMLHQANEAQLTSHQWWETLNAVNRDLMGADTPLLVLP